MNKNGFTLVELLAMMVVLGILIAVSIPNITGVLNSQKLNQIRTDAKKMVDNAKVKMATNKTITAPTNGNCIVLSLNNLDDSQDMEKGPNGGLYRVYDSFVVIKRINGKYEYYVRLIEEEESGEFFGIDLKTLEQAKNNSNVSSINDIGTELSGSISQDNTSLASLVSSKCSCNLTGYYPGNRLPTSP